MDDHFALSLTVEEVVVEVEDPRSQAVEAEVVVEEPPTQVAEEVVGVEHCSVEVKVVVWAAEEVVHVCYRTLLPGYRKSNYSMMVDDDSGVAEEVLLVVELWRLVV